MPIYLLIATTVIFVCIFFGKLSNRLGIPALLTFILLGMVFGSDGLFRIEFDDFRFAENICSVALVFIMFYGGFGTRWREAKPISTIALLLSTLGVVITAGLLGLFCHFIFKIGLLESFLLGAVISSTDAASVFSILRSRKLNLKYNTASLLEVESGSNDPCSYMLTIIVLSLMGDASHGGSVLYLIFAQLVYGTAFGIAIALGARLVLMRFRFPAKGFDTIFVFAIAILAYSAPEAIGGNGYLSVYIMGLILGNRPVRNKQSLVHFFDGLTGMMQILIFFLLGLLSYPSQMPDVLLPSALIALALTFIVRPIAVMSILAPFRCRLNQQLFVSFAGLRGAASIVFAAMAAVSSADVGLDVFHIVFCIVLFSILFQGSLLPVAAKKLKMLDDGANVMKTFNDYTEEVPVQFVQFTIDSGHSWAGKFVGSIILPPETILVLLLRGGKKIIPVGNTKLFAGDTLILSAKAPNINDGIDLTEIRLGKGNEWIGSDISSIELEPGKLIIMIQREERIVIPSGKTTLLENDMLVISNSET